MQYLDLLRFEHGPCVLQLVMQEAKHAAFQLIAAET